MPTKRFKYIFPSVFIALAIAVCFVVLWVNRQGQREVERFLNPEYPPVETLRVSRQISTQPHGNMLVFAQSSDIRDYIKWDDLHWMATNAGLAVGEADKVMVFHRPGGLPATELLRIALFRDEVVALAPEGLLVVRNGRQVRLGELTVELFRPASDQQFLDMAVKGETLWLLAMKGARGQILQFDGRSFYWVADFPGNATARLAMLHDRPVVGTAQGDLWVLEGFGEQAERKNLWSPERGDLTVTCLENLVDDLFVGTPTGAYRVDRLSAEPVLEGFAVSAVGLWNKEIWVGGPTGVVRSLKNSERFELGAPIHRLRGETTGLIAGGGDGLWTIVRDGQPTRTVAIEALRPFPEPYLTALLPRPGGGLLVGGLNRGLSLLDPAQPPARPAALEELGINDLEADGPLVWAATTNGLFELDGSLAERRRYTDKNGLPHRYVSAVTVGEEGVTLATTAGLAQIRPDGIRAIYALHGLAGNHLYCLTKWADGFATGGLAGLSLIGGPGGLSVQRNVTATDGGLPHNWVQAVAADGPRLMIGTYGGGVAVLEGDGPAVPAPKTAGMSINPGAALQVGNVTLFGTLLNGILVGIDGKEWSVFQEDLPSANVTALAGDETGVWVGTDRGLAFLPWEQLMQGLAQ